jgi:hypothetical protein
MCAVTASSAPSLHRACRSRWSCVRTSHRAGKGLLRQSSSGSGCIRSTPNPAGKRDALVRHRARKRQRLDRAHGTGAGLHHSVSYHPDIDTTVVVEANSDIVRAPAQASKTLIDDPTTGPCAIPADRIMVAVAASLRAPVPAAAWLTVAPPQCSNGAVETDLQLRASAPGFDPRRASPAPGNGRKQQCGGRCRDA